MKIVGITTEDLPTIIAGLVSKGLGFTSRQCPDGSWTVELTGAF